MGASIFCFTRAGPVRRGWVTAVLAACLSWAANAQQAPQQPQQQPLRVCADPDNLPFSKAEGPERGLYIEVAERVARQLQRPIEFVWYDSSYQRRALRNTIQAKACDAWFALPADAEYRARGLQKSVGFVHVGYALVAPPGLVFRRLDDLKGKRVAVAFASTPAVLLATMGGVTVVTQRNTAQALDSLARGEADAAFVWGPSAGYDMQRRYQGRWQLTSVTGHGLGGPVAAAVRRDQPELLQAIDQALGAMGAEIDTLAAKYGFPRAKPIDLDKTSALASTKPMAWQGGATTAVWYGAVPALKSVADTGAAGASKPAARKAAPKPAAKTSAAAVVATAAPAAATTASAAVDPLVAAGREKFNDVCSHCHSVDGASPMRERDLRRMKMRYDDKWVETAVKTIHEGRPQLGMPTWQGQMAEPDIERIVAFLKTIQK